MENFHMWYSSTHEKLGGILLYQINDEAITATKISNNYEDGKDYNFKDKVYLGCFKNPTLIWEGVVF